ncbi:MAG: phenylalanine--tRNA ligase subunit beta [Luteitalea sp.]|nr:phenylalanine--tRNA ligase subunit beta [Luteitalea sp.]
MKLLVSWVREFVNITARPADIAETMALRGFEVASIEHRDGGDAVIDFEVTANRPDCLSVVGFAREIGTAYGLPVRLPATEPDSTSAGTAAAACPSGRLTIAIEEPGLCPRYAAAVAETTSVASPAWMTTRLQAAGVRPISPFVDITNYVLLELGHPMHAFDLDLLDGRALRIRRARRGEPITTLDGVQRTLEPEMLVIADERRAQAIAGVMGGSTSEVGDATRTVAFESAYFAPASVRRTSKRLGLKTEASSRFERGADINAPVVALRRASSLMQEIGAGRLVGPVIDCYPERRGPSTVPLRRARLGALLGLDVPDTEVARILRSLGLLVSDAPEGWSVVVPTFRVDLLREVDLIEEVGRHHGFEKLEPAFPIMTAAAAAPDPRVSRDHLVRRVITAAGMSEAVTFGFIEARAAERFAPGGDAAQLVGVANPLSAKFDMLRPSLLPGLVDALAHNRRHGRRDVGLFEIGSRFSKTGGETRGVAFAWTGTAAAHWSAPPREVDLFDATGVVERLCSALKVHVRLTPAASRYLVPGQAAHALAGGAVVGVVGQLAPAIVDERGAPRQDRIVVAELDLELLTAAQDRGDQWVRPLPRHPFVVRDLSIIVSDALPAEIIHGTIQAAAGGAGAPLVSSTFFDRYQGAGVAEGSVSVSVRLTFQAADRTLTDAEVQQTFDRILAALVADHGARQR